MPTIQFDCLIDSENAASMTKRVRKLNELLIRDGKIVSADVTHDPHPPVEPLLEDQLRQILREQRDSESEYDEDDVVEASEDDVTVQRFSIDVSGVGGSLNELAMTYSRLLPRLRTFHVTRWRSTMSRPLNSSLPIRGRLKF